MLPRISVILPVFNAGQFIEESIDSLLAQTFGDFELLIINDGATDNTKEIILSKTDKRIVYIENERNLGLIKTLNKGLYFSKGAFIARMDADDVAYLQRLEKQVTHMENDVTVDVLGTGITMLDTLQHVILPYSAAQHKLYLLSRNTIAHPTVMIRRKSIQQQHLYYDKDALYAEDYKLWTDCSIRGLKIESLAEPLLYYRSHANQISSTRELQQYKTTVLIKLYYAMHYFPELVRNNEELYIDLICGNKHTPYPPEDTALLADRLIAQNNKDCFFDKKEFRGLLNASLDNILNNGARQPSPAG